MYVYRVIQVTSDKISGRAVCDVVVILWASNPKIPTSNSVNSIQVLPCRFP